MIITRPEITMFGSSYGKFGGKRITDLDATGDINSANFNKNTMIDGVEFNKFEETVKDYILAKLGYPTINIELTPFQLKTCIDEAITHMSYHAPRWTIQYAVFEAYKDRNVYELPPFIINNLENVYYKRHLLSIHQAGTIEFDFFLKYFQENKLFANQNIGEFYLMQQWLEQVRKILSQHGSWDVLDNKYIMINPPPVYERDPVILEYRALNSDTIHPSYRNWVQRYALAQAKEVLGLVRRKYKTLPGPGGGAQLDGAELVAEGKQDKLDLIEELRMELEEPPLFDTF